MEHSLRGRCPVVTGGGRGQGKEIALAMEREGVNVIVNDLGALRGRVALYSWPTEIKGLYKEGIWTLEELQKMIPVTLAYNLPKARG